jgi:hypothetical protein
MRINDVLMDIWQDMDLLNENRKLIHTGKLLRQPGTVLEWNELHVLLFDNYREWNHVVNDQ